VSDGFIIIDRRKNPKAKSLANRQRFVTRAKKSIRESAKKALGTKSMNDYGDTVVNIPTDGVDEPQFSTDPSVGEHDYVLPGNTEYVVGDEIRKPPKQGGAGGGGAGKGDGDGGGEDDFEFALNYEEYLNVIFDDLELPDLSKTTEKHAIAFVNRRAGYTNSGMPTNLNVPKTALAGMARRFALRAPKFKEIEELEKELEELKAALAGIDPAEAPHEPGKKLRTAASKSMVARIAEIEDLITTLRAKAMAISYLDDVDLRYNNFVKQPRPITQAVMFCMMDVSFSMGEREKIISKKFFILLHLFLLRRYANIDVVFVRHHDTANECDEETFFTSREGGGTIVSSGYEKIKEIIAARYNPEDWNIYLAQASDGDNYPSDAKNVQRLLGLDLLPVIQHFTYIEIQRETHDHTFYGEFGGMPSQTNLWEAIAPLSKTFDNISCAQISDERQVINVFRKLFKKESA
jgi:uncharacterized sporulation protein YeaH/YhbH (DUF444 family)